MGLLNVVLGYIIEVKYAPVNHFKSATMGKYMQAKKTVLVDIDNTIAQTQVAYINYANSVSPIPFKFEEIIKEFSDDPNDPFEALAHAFIISEDYSNTVRTIIPYDSARTALWELQTAGYCVCLASSRIENWHESTIHWLDDHNLLQYVDHIFLRTEDISSSDFKEQTALITGAVAAFDDSLSTVRALPHLRHMYLINQPWNRDATLPLNTTRAHDFQNAVKTFLENVSG